MKPSRQVETALTQTRLYRPARNAYQRLLNRAYFEQRRAGRSFLRQFVPTGGLAFDVGANRGLMSETFLELGARVVSVEPNPELADVIRRRYRSRRLSLVECAIGSEPGTATLYLGRDHIHSSIAGDWVELVRANPEWDDRWDGEVTVPVTTLGALIDEHGTPDFIKIDIEGFEDQAIAGLDRPVPSLSFEFQCPNLDIARRCIAKLTSLGDYDFAAANGETLGLSTGWMNADAILENLEQRRASQANAHGDVYARLRRSA